MDKDGMVIEEVAKILVHYLQPRSGSVTAMDSLRALGADDLDMVEIVLALEEKFKIFITDEETDKFIRVDDVIICVMKKLVEKKQRALAGIGTGLPKYPHSEPDGEISVKMDRVTFLLQKGEFGVMLSIDPDRRITLVTKDGHESFLFRKSAPEVVKAMAELMEKAVALVKAYDIPK